jgi:nucleoside-diphosphate-sugar epimerase
VDALLRIIDKPELCQGQIINLGNDKNDVSIRTLARKMVSAFRAQRPNAPPPRLRTQTAAAFYGAGYDDSIVRIPSMAKAARLLDWRPHMPLAQMLRPIVADYLARYEARAAGNPRTRAVAPGLP